jgi:phosphopantothenoylcysteine synthetase/decarboxylase
MSVPRTLAAVSRRMTMPAANPAQAAVAIAGSIAAARTPDGVRELREVGW